MKVRKVYVDADGGQSRVSDALANLKATRGEDHAELAFTMLRIGITVRNIHAMVGEELTPEFADRLAHEICISCTGIVGRLAELLNITQEAVIRDAETLRTMAFNDIDEQLSKPEGGK